MQVPNIKEVVVIGDIHGCYKTMLSLIAKAKEQFPNAVIASVGDLIDRGPSSKQVVQYFIDHPEHYVTLANHEDMMCTDMLGDVIDPYHGEWLVYQGGATLASYYDDATYKSDLNLMKEHAKWMKERPLYLEFPDCIVQGNDSDHGRQRKLVVSHASIGATWRMRDPSSKGHHFFRDKALWNRDAPSDVTDIYNVHGHTPQPEGPRIKSFYANIDTGCCLKRPFSELYGVLTGLHVPSMTIIQQENIE